MANFSDDAYKYVSELEKRNKIVLSDEAKQMLILPLIEIQKIYDRKDRFRLIDREFQSSLNYWRKSLELLVDNITYEPAKIDRANDFSENERTSLSVIKAFANKFCNIPPFCKEK